ncbi:MAG: peptide chain release factor-like protein [Lentisphaeria bacterium]
MLGNSESDLLKLCRVESFRGSGKGGQKRNVTDSAVRVTHEQSAISGESDKTRSQHRNRSLAIQALRRAIAIQWREPFPNTVEQLPEKPGARNPDFAIWMATVLDLLNDCDWQVSKAAKRVGKSTGQLVKDLAQDLDLWKEVNRQRQTRGIKALRVS